MSSLDVVCEPFSRNSRKSTDTIRAHQNNHQRAKFSPVVSSSGFRKVSSQLQISQKLEIFVQVINEF